MFPPFPNRPMKFWEVMSGFREYPQLLFSVLSSAPWKDQYLDAYKQINQLINAQNREKLDSVVPLALTRQICAACPAKFYLQSDGWLSAQQLPDENNFRVLSALEVHTLFGPAVIEEVNEKGTAKVA